MLAILLIEMQWTKENRSPTGAVQRQKYYQPLKIEDGVELAGEGVFLKRCKYYQYGDTISCDCDISEREEKEILGKSISNPFTGKDEHKHKTARLRNQGIRKKQGSFYDMEKLNIPCITIEAEPNECYRIKWFDSKEGMPRRRGGNEDLYKKGARLAGQPNVLNETAFVLEQGKAGVLKYNYRYISYDGQWYKCYHVYIVNAVHLTQDVFRREYDFEYNQLADLF